LNCESLHVTLILHHVGILVPDVAQAAGRYVETFGYRVCGPIVHDPVQTAYVQLLALNGSVPT